MAAARANYSPGRPYVIKFFVENDIDEPTDLDANLLCELYVLLAPIIYDEEAEDGVEVQRRLKNLLTYMQRNFAQMQGGKFPKPTQLIKDSVALWEQAIAEGDEEMEQPDNDEDCRDVEKDNDEDEADSIAVCDLDVEEDAQETAEEGAQLFEIKELHKPRKNVAKVDKAIVYMKKLMVNSDKAAAKSKEPSPKASKAPSSSLDADFTNKAPIITRGSPANRSTSSAGAANLKKLCGLLQETAACFAGRDFNRTLMMLASASAVVVQEGQRVEEEQEKALRELCGDNLMTVEEEEEEVY